MYMFCCTLCNKSFQPHLILWPPLNVSIFVLRRVPKGSKEPKQSGVICIGAQVKKMFKYSVLILS